MRFLKSIIGYFLAGFLINLLWGKLTNIFGLSGGWLAGLIVVGPIWFLNHHCNFVSNKNEAIFIDMGLAVAIANIVLGIINKNNLHILLSIEKSFLTLFLLGLGAVSGVLFSINIENKIIYKYRKKGEYNG